MASLRLHAGADADYCEAFAWYAERDPAVAERFEREVEIVLEKFQDEPRGWAVFDDRHHFARIKRFPHLVIFRSDGDLVWIVAIAHPSRDQSYWQDRSP